MVCHLSVKDRVLHLINTEGQNGAYAATTGLKSLAGELGITHEAQRLKTHGKINIMIHNDRHRKTGMVMTFFSGQSGKFSDF